MVHAKRPFAGPEAVLAYLSRYTHRVAIANSRLIGCDGENVRFRWKDYRLKGPARYKSMQLTTDEFIRRFLLHVLPGGFHRIRHYGLPANAVREESLERVRELLLGAAAVAALTSIGHPLRKTHLPGYPAGTDRHRLHAHRGLPRGSRCSRAQQPGADPALKSP